MLISNDDYDWRFIIHAPSARELFGLSIYDQRQLEMCGLQPIYLRQNLKCYDLRTLPQVLEIMHSHQK